MTISGPKLAGIGMTSNRTRARMVERLRAEGIRDEVVLAAIGAVPRHIFVDEALAIRAYEDTPLPIGSGQTMSQPWVVARMIELARAGGALGRVLEVGTGCGYQTAVLAELSGRVWSVEIVEEFAAHAEALLQALGYDNVGIRVGDGSRGWPEHAPFDKILLTVAAERAPPALIEQLKEGGRLVLPVGPQESQFLTVIDKGRAGRLKARKLIPVRFTQLETV